MQETRPGPQLLLQEIATELFETDFRLDKRGERLRYTLTPVHIHVFCRDVIVSSGTGSSFRVEIQTKPVSFILMESN